MTSLQHLHEAAESCAYASAIVKQIVSRAANIQPESPRTLDDELDLRAALALAVENMRVCSIIFDEAMERANNELNV